MDVRENTALGGGALHLQSDLYAGNQDPSAATANVAIGAHAMMQAGNAAYNVAIGNFAMVGEFDFNGAIPAVQYSAEGNTAIGSLCMQVPALPVMEDANAASMFNTAVGMSAARMLHASRAVGVLYKAHSTPHIGAYCTWPVGRHLTGGPGGGFTWGSRRILGPSRAPSRGT